MNVNLTALNMSHLISSDAPLSPLSDWDHQQHSPTSLDFALNYNYQMPSPQYSVGSLSSASPVPVSRVLRGRMSPDTSDSEQQLCLPTHQLFDMTYAPSPETFSSPPAVQEPLPQQPRGESVSLVPSKRSSSVAPTAAKKPRASAISTKDFVPPDVSGLSKREARLVKNRAAAFLSRQRKREEFENMELRVAELEQENARLLALAQSGGKLQEPPQQEELLSEVEQLRAQLAAAQDRERELSEELAHKAAARSAPVKTETVEPQLSLRNAPALPHKSGASLGLMVGLFGLYSMSGPMKLTWSHDARTQVLLCALPSLLSLPTHSAMPTSFSMPLSNAVQSAPFDMHSFVPGEFDWLNSGGSIMDVDIDAQGRISAGSFPAQAGGPKRLEFVDVDSQALGLSGLDISFDATPSHDGKIRVRIHPPSSAFSESNSQSDNEDQAMWAGSEYSSSASPSAYAGDADQLGPFLGIGSDYGMAMASHMSVDTALDLSSPTSASFSSLPVQESTFDFGYNNAGFDMNTRRRVRIALKSLPGEGREGGEWEVQVC
ncbi:hypothetical protein EW026_g2829 [Hermanssonia centrifuga]|uniref:BZIP domain-containing protein n=1 Tax=Hermanssonia centrifuga TaxID=98765 RepID=A0A4S4KRM1_9APHY|nr:hypothetical protein EW026_g2829 [Hermanssonia centrifuga]